MILGKLNRLIEIITDIAAGRYANDIMELTGPDTEEPMRTIAEALGQAQQRDLLKLMIEGTKKKLQIFSKTRPRMGKTIYEKKNQIAYVTLNRPDALNALDDEINDELWAIWRDFNEDSSVNVAVLTGAGNAFCAGADLKTLYHRQIIG